MLKIQKRDSFFAKVCFLKKFQIEDSVFVFSELLEDHALIEKLASAKYDFFLASNFDYCNHGLNHLLQIPSSASYSALAQDPLGTYALGIPQPPSYVPRLFAFFIQKFAKNCLFNLLAEVFGGFTRDASNSFFARLRTFSYSFDLNYDPDASGTSELEYLKTCIPNLPPIENLVQKYSFLFGKLQMI